MWVNVFMQTSWCFLFGFLMCCEWIQFWPGSCVCFEILFWTLFIPLDLRNIHNQALYWLVSSLVFSSVSEGVFFISGSCLIMLVRFRVQSIQVSSLCCHQRLVWKSVFSLCFITLFVSPVVSRCLVSPCLSAFTVIGSSFVFSPVSCVSTCVTVSF